MEKRRQRIMRKYLRERSNVVESDLAVPIDTPEDNELADFEQFKEMRDDLQQQESAAPMMPPPPRQPHAAVADRNWLLDVDPAMVEDPFSPISSESESNKSQKDWSTWGTERDRSPYDRTQRDGLFGRTPQEDSSPYSSRFGDRQEKGFNSREFNPFSSGKDQQRQTVPGGGYSGGIFGSKKEGTSGLGTFDLSRDRTYDPNKNRSNLQSPFVREPTPSADRSIGFGSKGQGYTPYKSPYETRRQQQQQQWGGQNQSGPEYKRQDPYQEWKKRNPNRFDPTGDDAYIDELMPKSGR